MLKKTLNPIIITLIISLLFPLQIWAADSSNSFQVPFSELNFGGGVITSNNFEVFDSLSPVLSETPSSTSFGVYEGTLGMYASLVPSCNSFTASQTTIENGESVSLSWNVSDALNASINQGVGAIALPSDSISVSPSTTTSYVLTAQNGAFQNQCTVTVTVTASAPPPAAECLFFVAEPASIILGQSTTLKWFAKHAVSANMNQGIGAVTLPAATRIITPTSNTTYTLTLSNGASDVTCQVEVVVNSAPVFPSVGRGTASERPSVGGKAGQILLETSQVIKNVTSINEVEVFLGGMNLVEDESGERKGGTDLPLTYQLESTDNQIPAMVNNQDIVNEVPLGQHKTQSLSYVFPSQSQLQTYVSQKSQLENDSDIEHEVESESELFVTQTATDYHESQLVFLWFLLLLLLIYIIARYDLIISKNKNTLLPLKTALLPKKKMSTKVKNKQTVLSIKKSTKKSYSKYNQ